MDAFQSSSPSAAHQTMMKHACASCARRKIRCDRRQPCSNCVSHARISARRSRHRESNSNTGNEMDVDCVYLEPPPAQRHRRKVTRTPAVVDGLLDRLRLYEDLLRKNDIATPEILSQRGQQNQQPLPRPLSREGEDDGEEDVVKDDRTWIASPWEAKMAMHKGPAPISIAQTPSSAADTLVVSDALTEAMGSWPVTIGEDAADAELDLWQSLLPELRNPPISSVFARRFFGQKSGDERQADDNDVGATQPTMPNISGLFGMASTMHPVSVQHPEPRIILRLWQAFIDNVNPIMRIVHVPTTHLQIVDASWDAANAPPAVGALMFAIYTLALISMSTEEYTEMFTGAKTGIPPPPPRRELIVRYRMGATQCLLAAGLLTTRRVDVLRAFTLLILAEPDSELSSTLASIAIHLGLKMGLHRETDGGYGSNSNSSGGLSFFEREMRVRLWWQIRGIDARMRTAVSLSHTNALSNIGNGHGGGGGAHAGNYFGSNMMPPDLGDARLPLNINDADLHPAMTGPPVEHTGPTENMYILMKYETARWMRAFAQKKFASVDRLDADASAAQLYRSQALPAMKDRAIDELEQLYMDRCFRNCDPRIPLHAITSSMARMAVAQLRFQARHPRTTSTPPSASSPHVFSRQNADAVFRHALSILELCFACRQVAGVGNSFAAFQLLADIVMRVVMDATIYVVCMLRVRVGRGKSAGDDKESIDTAWRMIELFYDEYGDDLATAASDYEQHRLHVGSGLGSTRDSTRDSNSSSDEAAEESWKLAAGAAFVTAFTDLTLEAWDAREASSLPGDIQKPEFIANLQAQKEKQRECLAVGELPLAASGGPDWGGLLFQDDQAMDWEYWNNFLQM